jgi:eukaryotic-like serine/threonine-protein kinase
MDLICLKCLRKEPRERYASARELAEDLDRFLRGEPIHALASSAWQRMRRWGRRRWVAALLTLVLLIGTGGLFWEWRAIQRHDRDAENQVRRTEEALDEAEASLFRIRLNLARQAFDAGQVLKASELLRQCLPSQGRPDRRDREWHDLWRHCEEKLPSSRRE